MSQVVAPFVDAHFSESAFGFRPNRGAADALAAAIRITERQSHWVWLCHDVHAAFDSLPRHRLFDLLPFLPPEMRRVLERLVDPGSRRGIAQGCPISPLLMNVYFDHFVDQPWKKRFPKIPLLRYADDILVLCPNRLAAQLAHYSLNRLIRNAGLKLRDDFAAATFNLRDESAHWLGYEVTTLNNLLIPRIAERAWLRLRIELLPRARSPEQVRQSVRGWLMYQGPAYGGYSHKERSNVYRRLRDMLADATADDVPGKVLSDWWRKSWDNFLWRLHRDPAEIPAKSDAPKAGMMTEASSSTAAPF
jgi:hypothetical protein